MHQPPARAPTSSIGARGYIGGGVQYVRSGERAHTNYLSIGQSSIPTAESPACPKLTARCSWRGRLAAVHFVQNACLALRIPLKKSSPLPQPLALPRPLFVWHVSVSFTNLQSSTPRWQLCAPHLMSAGSSAARARRPQRIPSSST